LHTPTTGDTTEKYEKRYPGGRLRKSPVPNLAAEIREGFAYIHKVRMLPTPTTSGLRGTGPMDGIDALIDRSLTSHQTGMKTGLKLQPAFALWMMGFPVDWCDLADGEMPRSRRRATP
jgi:hypothetical protein